MSIETYDKQLALLEVYKKLDQAEKQVLDGEKLLDSEKVFENLKQKYGKSSYSLKIAPIANQDLE
jgi:hypothetical protein